ncbi:MAG: hypothetical protein GXP13_08860 [Gammaproteobacteria bacterium]|nr:hypothetical protein [Gammaproteobacteria bacterium]
MKPVFLIILLTASSPVYSSQEILGKFTTVSEAACNSEIHFFKHGKGVFIDSCRNEDGIYFGKIYTDDISWQINNNRLTVKINGLNESFTYHKKLSCHYFGEDGFSNGLVGFDLYFWRTPVKCK